ncbi:hypothetical protein [Sediminicola arcticus]|uniref:DUF4440 domain-containing protein n=1 Tax=Sediminicola arcticus TaxID=1574308 RepID=A0ABV2SYH6_9FLAO
MKTKNTFILFITLVSMATTFAQKSNINKDLKMYSQVWDDIVNKGQIDRINTENFATDITLVTSPENIVGIEGFKAYYQKTSQGFRMFPLPFSMSLDKTIK